MCDLEKLREHFQFMGQSPTDEILNKCLELCTAHHLSEEDLVDQWIAFSLSNFKDAKPTLHGLELMERNDFGTKTNKKQSAAPIRTPKRKIPAISSQPSTPEQVVPASTPEPTTIQHQPDHIVNNDIPSSPVPQVESYSKREERGVVVYKHGANTSYIPCFAPVDVKLFEGLPHQGIPVNARYMLEGVQTKQISLSDISTYVASYIARNHKIDLPETMFKYDNYTDECVYGRIATDGNGKLNSASILLELPSEVSKGDMISLNMQQVKSFSIFPGQTVVAKGTWVRKKNIVKEIFTTNNRLPTSICTITDPVQIIVAAGPFSVKSDLNYEPLQDLLKYVLEKKPHVLILTGPFIDSENDFASNGDMTESYDMFFQTLVESVMAPLKETNISVVFVSSSQDAHHHVVYPTPPYKLKKKYPNLICAPDPCLLHIHGLIIGITTVDTLFHIGKQELCWPSLQGDRMARLSGHILSQNCFYPLYPPENNVSIDHELLEKFGIMETVPHLLILPSSFKRFVKKVQGCTVVNPERLVKGYAGGTFARINVTMKEDVDISCEIIRI